jgi:glycerophosphoryl diester phosphodiesterase
LRPHLARKCSVPFRPPTATCNATVRCCTIDFTLEKIQTGMCGKMRPSSENIHVKTAEDYASRMPGVRIDLYSHNCPRVQSHLHADFVRRVYATGGGFVPEAEMLNWEFASEEGGRRAFVDRIMADYDGIDPSRMHFQGFDWEDVYRVVNGTVFGANAFALDEDYGRTASYGEDQLCMHLQPLMDNGVGTVVPTMFVLLDVDGCTGNIMPSAYATDARDMGLDIMAWVFERSEVPLSRGGGFYYSKLAGAVCTESDMIKVLDVLYKDVGIKGIFTDWPSVVTFYANCKGIALQ